MDTPREPRAAREDERQTLGTRGQITLPNGYKIEIMAQDMSRRGARITLPRMVILPDRFVVEVFSPEGDKVRRCDSERRWQRGTAIGVKFLNSKTTRVG